MKCINGMYNIWYVEKEAEIIHKLFEEIKVVL